MKALSQCCRNCTHLVVQPDSAGRRVVRKDYVYPCDAQVDFRASLPEALYRYLERSIPKSGFMPNALPEGGETCSFYQERQRTS